MQELNMLQKLHISNYALIDKAIINFTNGLTIITGETGAGKSILLDAIGLLMGNRPEPAAINKKEEKTIIEAWFDIGPYDLQPFFDQNDLEFDELSILRREISLNGKSRAFINDSPVNISVLKALTTRLIDIHAQHQTHDFAEHTFRFNLLSDIGNFKDLYQSYQSFFSAFKKKHQHLQTLKDTASKAMLEQDFIQFQYDELEQAKIESGEDEKLKQTYLTLSNAEDISKQLFSAISLLDNDERGLLNSLKTLLNFLQSAGKFSDEIAELGERIQTVHIEVKDIYADLSNASEKHQPDPTALAAVSERLDVILGLLQKHRLHNCDELIAHKEILSSKLNQTNAIHDEINALVLELDQMEMKLNELAAALHDRRKAIIPKIKTEVEKTLKQLQMPDAQFDIQLNSTKELNKDGNDEIKLLFTANKGKQLQALEQVASGGELSRLMLSIKKLLTKAIALPTIIFDEIDTGVSGAVADAMGQILSEMSAKTQVIAVTHLPQVAVKGIRHLKVRKMMKEDVVISEIVSLDDEARVMEIAGMLSGKKLTDAAIENARALFN